VTGKRLLRPVSAWRHAAIAAGAGVGQVAALGKTANGSIGLAAAGFSGQQTVRPTMFGTPSKGAIRAYDATVTKTTVGAQSSYRVIVDAATGKLLYRQNLVDNATDNPTWLALPAAPPYNPMNAFPWNYPSTDTRRLDCWTATTGCTNVVSDATTVNPMGVASKFPWDVQLDIAGTNLGTMQTTGNNVDEGRVWSGNHGVYGNPALFRATSATRDYQPAWTNAWFNAGCNPANLNTDTTANPAQNDAAAASVNLFVGHNVMHDYAYYLGFDEGHWNAQQYNNGVSSVDPFPTPGGPTATPVGNDGLNGNVQSGAVTGSRDNANMNTGADGVHPTTNMFLWQSIAGSFYAPCVDGDYDFSVYGHEFGHMIENRMIGKGVGARQGNAAGAMGEAFGDFDALEVMNALGVAPVPGSDRYTEGAYVTGNGYNGIRDFLAGRPMGGQFPLPGQNPDTDPLNYGDFGFDLTGPEVHADGEIWIATQIDLRDLFLRSVPVERDRRGHRVRPRPDCRVVLSGRPALDPGLLRRDGDVAAEPDHGRCARRDARGGRGPFRRCGSGPPLAGLRIARLRPVPEHERDAGHEPDARLLVAARGQRDVELLRGQQGEHPRPGQREDLRGRLPGSLDADRGHRPVHQPERHARDEQPGQHRAVHPEHGQLALEVVQLHRGRARLRGGAVQHA
jgi:hypothetical protein